MQYVEKNLIKHVRLEHLILKKTLLKEVKDLNKQRIYFAHALKFSV